MGKKMKLKLDDLKVQSFVTNDIKEENVKGGTLGVYCTVGNNLSCVTCGPDQDTCSPCSAAFTNCPGVCTCQTGACCQTGFNCPNNTCAGVCPGGGGVESDMPYPCVPDPCPCV